MVFYTLTVFLQWLNIIYTRACTHTRIISYTKCLMVRLSFGWNGARKALSEDSPSTVPSKHQEGKAKDNHVPMTMISPVSPEMDSWTPR